MGVEVLRLRGLYRLSFWGVFRVYSVCGFVLESLGLVVFFFFGGGLPLWVTRLGVSQATSQS